MGKKAWILITIVLLLIIVISVSLYAVIKINNSSTSLNSSPKISSTIKTSITPLPLPSIAVLSAINSFYLTGVIESTNNDKNIITFSFKASTKTFKILASDGVVPISFIKTTPYTLQPATRADIMYLKPADGENKLNNYIGKVVTLHFYERKIGNDTGDANKDSVQPLVKVVNNYYECNQKLYSLVSPSPTPGTISSGSLSCTPFTDKIYVFD